VSQPKIAEKFIKNPYYEGSRSFKVIDVESNKKLVTMLVMISSMSVPICNRVHATRDNSSKITTFRGVAVFDARLRRPL